VALFKQFHARALAQAPKPLWQKSEGGNLFMRGQSGQLVIRRKKLKKLKKRKHSEGGGESRELVGGVMVRRRKTRKDKGVAKTHGKYARPGGEGREGETVLHLSPEEEVRGSFSDRSHRVVTYETSGGILPTEPRAPISPVLVTFAFKPEYRRNGRDH
jgi:hypothetical protein